MEDLSSLLEKALAFRKPLFDDRHITALRLFNGFIEGCPKLVIDLYGRTLVLQDHSSYGEDSGNLQQAAGFLHERLPWLSSAVVKRRDSPNEQERRGLLLFGNAPDRKVREYDVWYALDLCLHQDTGLYLDTRLLRRWAIDNLGGKSVLNTFAYTGSLGAAAFAGGALRVVQMDIDRQFLNLAKTSCTLNGFPIHRGDFMQGDFWSLVGRLRREGEHFGCVFLDPPLFSKTEHGSFDLNRDSPRLINKVRPLVEDGGWLVAVNNALYVSGRDYIRSLEALCVDGYMKIDRLIPVPDDCLGYPETRISLPVTDPAPFNASTKIAVLTVKRK